MNSGSPVYSEGEALYQLQQLGGARGRGPRVQQPGRGKGQFGLRIVEAVYRILQTGPYFF